MNGKRTYAGIAIMLAPLILNFFDVTVSEVEIQTIINSCLTAVGGVVAIYGRYKATK